MLGEDESYEIEAQTYFAQREKLYWSTAKAILLRESSYIGQPDEQYRFSRRPPVENFADPRQLTPTISQPLRSPQEKSSFSAKEKPSEMRVIPYLCARLLQTFHFIQQAYGAAHQASSSSSPIRSAPDITLLPIALRFDKVLVLQAHPEEIRPRSETTFLPYPLLG